MEKNNYSQSLTEQLQTAIEGLYYPSESDEKLEIMSFDTDFDIKNDESILKKSVKAKSKDKIEICDFEDFWNSICTPQDWWTEFENDRMRKFLILKDLLKLNLTNINYLKIGKVEIKAIILGQDKDCNWIGIKTLIVES